MSLPLHPQMNGACLLLSLESRAFLFMTPFEFPWICTCRWEPQVNEKNNNVLFFILAYGKNAVCQNYVHYAFFTFYFFLLFERNFSWGSLLSKLMWQGSPFLFKIVTWGLFLHTFHEAKCEKLSQRWFFHRTLMYTGREIVEKGLGEGKNLHSHNWPLAN